MKKLIKLVIGVCVLASLFCSHAFASDVSNEFAGGAGTLADPYIIITKSHLDRVRHYLDANFKLSGNIEFAPEDFSETGLFYNNGTGWLPIGEVNTPFTGTFDGDGYVITGLEQTIVSSSSGAGGLFAYLKGATVKNLGILSSRFSYTSQGYATHVGSIVGSASGSTIQNCYSNSSVVSINETVYGACAGGIVGHASGNIACPAALIVNCFNTGSVEATQDAGGVVGQVSSSGSIIKIESCYNSGSVVAQNSSGGVVGRLSEGSVVECFNTGSITANSHAGGIIGEIYGDKISRIETSYNSGSVAANGSPGYAGGVLGYLYTSPAVLAQCYNVGVVSGTTWTGGMVGYAYAGSASVSGEYCYYLDSCDKAAGAGWAPKGKKCTATEMMLQSTFEGFDFVDTWETNADFEYPYPMLMSVHQGADLCAAFGHNMVSEICDRCGLQTVTVSYDSVDILNKFNIKARDNTRVILAGYDNWGKMLWTKMAMTGTSKISFSANAQPFELRLFLLDPVSFVPQRNQFTIITAEDISAYVEFKQLFAISLREETDNDELLFDAVYCGQQSQRDFLRTWS